MRKLILPKRIATHNNDITTRTPANPLEITFTVRIYIAFIALSKHLKPSKPLARKVTARIKLAALPARQRMPRLQMTCRDNNMPSAIALTIPCNKRISARRDMVISPFRHSQKPKPATRQIVQLTGIPGQTTLSARCDMAIPKMASFRRVRIAAITPALIDGKRISALRNMIRQPLRHNEMSKPTTCQVITITTRCHT